MTNYRLDRMLTLCYEKSRKLGLNGSSYPEDDHPRQQEFPPCLSPHMRYWVANLIPSLASKSRITTVEFFIITTASDVSPKGPGPLELDNLPSLASLCVMLVTQKTPTHTRWCVVQSLTRSPKWQVSYSGVYIVHIASLLPLYRHPKFRRTPP